MANDINPQASKFVTWAVALAFAIVILAAATWLALKILGVK